MDKSNMHKNHRERVRMRFIADGNLDNFHEHQILELLLFYIIPRKDTNELAHRLINEYGSLYNLMSASPEEIKKRCKINIKTAILISIVPHIYRRYLQSEQKKKKQKLTSFKVTAEYFKALLDGKVTESFYMICLDINKNVKKIVKISDGNSNEAPIYIEVVVKQAILQNANFVMIGHNHPAGNPRPSVNDLNATTKIIEALKLVNVVVVDHIIIYNGGYYSFAQNQNCGLSYTRVL